MSELFFEYNKGKIYFEVSGHGEPIVFLHGFSLDHHMWREQVSYFSNKYQVITYDFRGFGTSSIPSDQYSHTKDLCALLSHLGIKQAHIVGLSLGGEIAIDFAIEFPALVKSLTIADSSLGGYRSTVDWDVHAKDLGLEAGKKNWLNHPVFAQTRKNAYVTEQLNQMITVYTGWHWLNRDTFRLKPDLVAVNHLKKITQRTLILLGSEDLNYYQSIATILKKGIPNSRLKVITGAGHMSNMENADNFNDLVGRFIGAEVDK